MTLYLGRVGELLADSNSVLFCLSIDILLSFYAIMILLFSISCCSSNYAAYCFLFYSIY